MKARKLKELLNNTKYAISDHNDYIAVGSPLCHDLFSVNKKTMKIKYALDAFNEGRKSVRDRTNDEMLFIWDKLQSLIDSGELLEIINGSDHIENPLPVFTVKDGKLIESYTDEYGWPNTDQNGVCMYENTHFPDKQQALEYGIREAESGIEIYLNRIKDREQEIEKAKQQIARWELEIVDLCRLK